MKLSVRVKTVVWRSIISANNKKCYSNYIYFHFFYVSTKQNISAKRVSKNILLLPARIPPRYMPLASQCLQTAQLTWEYEATSRCYFQLYHLLFCQTNAIKLLTKLPNEIYKSYLRSSSSVNLQIIRGTLHMRSTIQ